VLSSPVSSPPTATATSPSRWARFWPIALIAVATLAAYSNSLSVPFLFDDEFAIVNNPAIRRLWPVGDALGLNSASRLTTSGRPFLNLTFAINHALSGTEVWSYHALNLAIHVLAGLTLFGVVRRTLARVGRVTVPAVASCEGWVTNPPAIAAPDRRVQDNAPRLIGLVVALIWTLHPLQTEAVTYLVQRAESMMGLFYLLTLYCFIRGAEGAGEAASRRDLDVGLPGVADVVGAQTCCARPRGRGRPADEVPAGRDKIAPLPEAGDGVLFWGRWRPEDLWFALSVLACLLGMATKEVMVTAPVMVLLYDRTFVAGSFQAAWRQRRSLYLWLAATWIPLGFLIASTGGNRGGMFVFSVSAFWAYWLTQFEAIARYVWLAVWPHPLVFEYGPLWVHRVVDMGPYAVVVVAMAGATLIAVQRSPPLGFLGVWFFAILAPTSLMPGTTEMIVEHRVYLSLAAVVVLVVAGLHRWMGRYSLAAGLALAVVCGGLTFARNRDYRSELSLWEDTVEKRPHNGLAQLNFGSALFALGRFSEAGERFAAALRINPCDAEAENNLGAALAHLGRPQEAIAHYEAALRLKPGYAKAEYELGLVLLDLGRPQEAGEHLERVLRVKTDNAEAENNLGVALARLGHPQEAVAHYAAALRIRPDYAEAEYNLASLLLDAGRTQEAIGHFEQALRLRPGHPDILNNLAGALLKEGRTKEAIDRYVQALRITPDRVDLHLNLGVALAKAGRLEEAIAQFREAIRLKPDHADTHLALARALSQVGREPEAIAHREEGLRLQSGQPPRGP
jgi:tetratricopeptide (TPR) repeat protein